MDFRQWLRRYRGFHRLGMDQSDEGFEALELVPRGIGRAADGAASGDRMVGREVAGQEILAGVPVSIP